MIKKLISVFAAFTVMLMLCSFVMLNLSDEKNQENKIEGKIVYNKKKHSKIVRAHV